MVNQITEPLKYVSQLFNEHLSSPGNSPVNFDPSPVFLNILKEHKNEIVSVNNVPLQQLPKNSLVRFRCMIQDTGLGQEMFVSAYHTLDKDGNKQLNSYYYNDDPIEFIELDDNNILNNDFIAERSLVYCVSPPAENKWSKLAYSGKPDDLSAQLNQLEIKETNPIVAKKFPVPGNDHTSSIVKFYGEMGESVKVGQLVEVIGIRGQDIPKLSDNENDFETVLNMYTDVPVIHAIAYHELGTAKHSPYENNINLAEAATQTRDELISYIASAIGGDRLAAEFILLQLLSRVTVKNRGLKIGNFTLNITGCPSYNTTEEDKKKPLLTMNNPLSKGLANILENLTVHSLNLPLTINGLNKSRFSPKSTNENLEAGLLQLVDGTVVLVDETVLDEGQLVDSGVRNFQALQNVIQHQTLTYEFPYSQYDFDTDLSVITLSSSKSMLSNHCSIRLDTTNSVDVDNVDLSQEMLETFRKFIHFAKHLDYDIPDDVSEYIQTRFVNDRKSASKNGTTLPTQEELMLHMNLARLVALSFGEQKLTNERYDYAIQLDEKRKSRVK